MTDHATANLDHRRRARSDGRIWFALVVGLGVVGFAVASFIGVLSAAEDPPPIWMPIVFASMGLMMAGLSAVSLIFDTDRGCCIDEATQELVWWQMRFRGQALDGMHRIAVSEIGRVRVDQSGEGLDLSLFDRAGRRQDLFSELVLPKDYMAWVDALIRRWPHIDLEHMA